MTIQTFWKDSAGPITLNADQNFPGYTVRQIIQTGQLLRTGGRAVRVTFEASSINGLSVASAYIGRVADAGDAYDFASTPTQLKFSTANGFSIAGGASIVSDIATFSILAGKHLLVSFYVDGAGGRDSLRGVATQAGWYNYWKLANDPATVDATGYTLNSTKVIAAVKRVEIEIEYIPKVINII